MSASIEVPFLFSPPPGQPDYGNGINAHTLAYSTGAGPQTSFVFASLEEATDFRKWLRQARPGQAKPAGGKLANGMIGVIAAGKFRPLNSGEYAQVIPGPENEKRESNTPHPPCTLPLKG